MCESLEQNSSRIHLQYTDMISQCQYTVQPKVALERNERNLYVMHKAHDVHTPTPLLYRLEFITQHSTQHLLPPLPPPPPRLNEASQKEEELYKKKSIYTNKT